jgi:hypothetical protein
MIRSVTTISGESSNSVRHMNIELNLLEQNSVTTALPLTAAKPRFRLPLTHFQVVIFFLAHSRHCLRYSHKALLSESLTLAPRTRYRSLRSCATPVFLRLSLALCLPRISSLSASCLVVDRLRLAFFFVTVLSLPYVSPLSPPLSGLSGVTLLRPTLCLVCLTLRPGPIILVSCRFVAC